MKKLLLGLLLTASFGITVAAQAKESKKMGESVQSSDEGNTTEERLNNTPKKTKHSFAYNCFRWGMLGASIAYLILVLKMAHDYDKEILNDNITLNETEEFARNAKQQRENEELLRLELYKAEYYYKNYGLICLPDLACAWGDYAATPLADSKTVNDMGKKLHQADLQRAANAALNTQSETKGIFSKLGNAINWFFYGDKTN